MVTFRVLWALAVLVAAPAALADVVKVSTSGFEVRLAAHVASPPAKAYAALTRPARWWSSAHTYSQNAANLTLEATPGGCFCEKLSDGRRFDHMHTVEAEPGKRLTLKGALGPFRKMAVDGLLTFTIKPGSGGSDLTMTYTITGSAPDGFAALAKDADGMLAEQWASLRALLGG